MLDTNTVTELLLLYLENQKSKKVTVNYTDTGYIQNIPYRIINFAYLSVIAEIHVYNPQFILIKRLDSYSKMCDNITIARSEIDKLISHDLYYTTDR